METEEKDEKVGLEAEKVGLDHVSDETLAAIVETVEHANHDPGESMLPYQVAAFSELARRSGHEI